MFLHVSVILLTGRVGFPACITGHMTNIQGVGFPIRACITGHMTSIQGGGQNAPSPIRIRKAGGLHPTGILSYSIYEDEPYSFEANFTQRCSEN